MPKIDEIIMFDVEDERHHRDTQSLWTTADKWPKG
jgi:hypothetical protein